MSLLDTDSARNLPKVVNGKLKTCQIHIKIVWCLSTPSAIWLAFYKISVKIHMDFRHRFCVEIFSVQIPLRVCSRRPAI